MPKFAQVQSGRVRNVIVLDAAPDPMVWGGLTIVFVSDGENVQPGDTYSGGAFARPEAPSTPTSWHITKLAFRNRYTSAEKAAIELAAADNPAATTQARTLAASLRATLGDQRDAIYIDLQRADTRNGVESLEAAGLIASGRAATILDTAPNANEIYRPGL